jgi:hypothetical protein
LLLKALTKIYISFELLTFAAPGCKVNRKNVHIAAKSAIIFIKNCLWKEVKKHMKAAKIDADANASTYQEKNNIYLYWDKLSEAANI